MKKKIMICLVLLIVVINIVILTNPVKENENIKDISLISMNLQDEEGNYFETKNINFNQEGYHYNKRKSSCEGGSELSWQNGKLHVTTDKTDKCHIYLDNNSFVEDLSGNGHHGRGINIAKWDDEGITISDDTKNGYINCGLLGYDFGNQLSVVLRIKLNKIGATNGYFGNWESGGFGISAESKFDFEIWSTDVGHYTPIYSIEVPQINTWYTLVGTYDNQKLKLYINGILNSSVDLTGNIKVVNAMLAIGVNPSRNNPAGDYSYNTTSDALIFKRALTEEEIQQDYTDKINPTNKQDLLLWYKFD